MNCTDVANWRKWDSKTPTQSANLSGELPPHTERLHLDEGNCQQATDLPLCVRACSLQQTYEAKRQEFLVELQKREDEMRQMFVQRVKEKEAELKEAEREVCGRAKEAAGFSRRECTFVSSVIS